MQLALRQVPCQRREFPVSNYRGAAGCPGRSSRITAARGRCQVVCSVDERCRMRNNLPAGRAARPVRLGESVLKA